VSAGDWLKTVCILGAVALFMFVAVSGCSDCEAKGGRWLSRDMVCISNASVIE
jgi:hypothetical protein